MAARKPTVPFKLGDRVEIRLSKSSGRIVELRGPLGPGGVEIYRIRVRGKPRPAYTEVREDQLILIPDEADPPREKTDPVVKCDERGLAVPAKKPSAPFKLGERVKLRLSESSGQIVELRGPLGPGGAEIYRVRVRGKPRPAYIEVREDQLVLIPDEG